MVVPSAETTTSYVLRKLLASQAFLVHGSAGVGKTEFVKYAFDLWKSTRFFDKFSVVSMIEYLAEAEDDSSWVTSQIAKDLEIPTSF